VIAIDSDMNPVLYQRSSVHLITWKHTTSCTNQTFSTNLQFSSRPNVGKTTVEIHTLFFKVELVLHFPAPAIRSFIFQVLQIPGLRVGPSFSWYCIWQGLHFQSPQQVETAILMV